MRFGNLIIFTGMDGSGKTTAAEFLVNYLRGRGCSTKLVWIKSSHTLAYLLTQFFSRFQYERTIYNPNKVKIRQFKSSDIGSFRKIWPLIEFASVVPLIILKVYLPMLFGFTIVADRYLIDTVISIATRVEQPCFIEGFFSKCLLEMIPSYSVLIHLECSYGVLIKRRVDIEFTDSELRQQIRFYALLSRELGATTIDTTNNFQENRALILKTVGLKDQRGNL